MFKDRSNPSPLSQHGMLAFAGAYLLLLSSHVIGSVVDLHNFVLINLVLDKSNAHVFRFSKRDLVKVVFLAKNFTKGKVFETWNEMLY